MAGYDAAGARVGAAGHFASRLTAALVASGQVAKADVLDTFADFTVGALDVLNGLETQPTASITPIRPPATALEQELGASPATTATGLRIIGALNDEHPAWLFEAAAKKGVTAVFDNRADLATNSKRPWYKQAEPASEDPAPFWPPRPKGR
jgi:hypothetical protein